MAVPSKNFHIYHPCEAPRILLVTSRVVRETQAYIEAVSSVHGGLRPKHQPDRIIRIGAFQTFTYQRMAHTFTTRIRVNGQQAELTFAVKGDVMQWAAFVQIEHRADHFAAITYRE